MDPITIALGLASAAPSIIKLFGGSDDQAQVAATVVSTAQAVAGVQDPVAAAEKIKADPQTALAFQQALLAHEAAMFQAETERLRAQLADVQSARSQTIALAQAGSRMAWGAPLVSALVLGTFGVILGLVITRSIPESGNVSLMLGALTTMATAVVSYWVGSTAGSSLKTSMLAMSHPVGTTPAAPPVKPPAR